MFDSSSLSAEAYLFASKSHRGQVYGEYPYVYHLVQVANNVTLRMQGSAKLETYLTVAWLHDVIEDCGVTFEEIQGNFGTEVAVAVLALTRDKAQSYATYIQDCIDNPIAREVKICDTMANLTESFKSGNVKGLAKYPKQLDALLKGSVK